MSITAQKLIEEFDLLPDLDKRVVAAEILRRISEMAWPALRDEDFIQSAESVFLELDQRTNTGD